MKTSSLLVYSALLILLVGCNRGGGTQFATPAGEEPSPVTVEAGVASETSTSLLTTPSLIACSGELTSSNQEGPYYSPGSPQRSDLIENGMSGTPIRLFGQVFDQDCNPISGARLDFWQADGNGEYDNHGYTLRGHVFSEEDGSYSLETVEPGRYPGRPPHIHVKVFSPDNRELLTTQMYFAGSENSPDVTAAPDLLVAYLEPDENGRQQVLFNFVVAR